MLVGKCTILKMFIFTSELVGEPEESDKMRQN